jgi:DNA-binding response OmpR family regulator
MPASAATSAPYPAVLLYVDDDVAAAHKFGIVIADMAPGVQLHILGYAALAYKFLLHQSPFNTASSPDLIILDVNLIGESGFDILARIRQEPHLDGVPIVFFTTSPVADYKQLAETLGASEMIQKPLEFTDYESLPTDLLGVRLPEKT